MRRIVCIIVCVLHILVALSQEEVSLRRTPEERAMKQTEMLVRDLGITDSTLRDTLYRIHLKYVYARDTMRSRAEAVECMNRLLAELKSILPAADYERLQAIPLRRGARIPQCKRDSIHIATPPTPHTP